MAIVGPTGAGKTTLVNLMMRFYEPDAGRITLDGVDVTSVPRRELRSRLGMVLQDTWLFGGTIRDNIPYGRSGVTEEEILEWLMWTAPSGTNRFCPVVLVPSSNKFARHSKRNLV